MRCQVLALGLLALIGSVSSIPTASASAVNPSAGQQPAASVTTAASKSVQAPSGLAILASPDYPLAGWIPAASSNFTVSDRPASYQVNMIVIHSTEGSYSSAVTAFQDPSRLGSAHYVVSRTGRIAQMVLEQDIAWHAGNWDYNTRAIGIEHEGYAGVAGSFTLAEYRASAALAASICSRWGVPMDRNHVIGHYQVPDPNNPALGGGTEHHWDPGPYWNWTYYMSVASRYARYLPSPPHMGPDPIAASAEGAITLRWQPAQSCTAPITGYSVVGQPGNITFTLPATTTSIWIPGLTDGVGYTFTVTAHNAQGQSSLTSNTAIVGPACTSAWLTSSQSSPSPAGTTIQFSATSTICNKPEYAFWLKAPGARWSLRRDYGGAAWTWYTTGLAPGIYQVDVWARQKGSGNSPDAYAITTYSLGVGGPAAACASANLVSSVDPPQRPGTAVTFTATATGCASPEYQFGVMAPGGALAVTRPYGGATWNWDTAGLAPGTYHVAVWARQAGSTAAYETYFLRTYQLTVAICAQATISANPVSPRPAGTQISFTAATSPGCAMPRYEFWEQPPGGAWALVQPYGDGKTFGWSGVSPGATFRWSSTGAGTYKFAAWALAIGSLNVYDSYALTTFVNN